MRCSAVDVAEEMHGPFLPQLLNLGDSCLLAPTANNSEMTSGGMPLVSGTFLKTRIQEMTQTTA